MEEALIPSNGRALMHTLITVDRPPSCDARIGPRSCLAFLAGLDIRAGVIDADNRGNIGALLVNHVVFDLLVSILFQIFIN